MPSRSPIFFNPSPSLSADRAKLAALIDLIDAIKLTLEGMPVTVDVVRGRIRKLESERQAERVMVRMIETAKTLGFDAWRTPHARDMEGGPVADTRGRGSISFGKVSGSVKKRGYRPAFDEPWVPGRWALRFDRPEELLAAAQAAVEKMLGESSAGAVHYALLKDLGLCVGCRKVPPRPGKVHCTECAEEWRERYQRRVAAGLCPRCRGPLESGQATCEKCLAGDRALARERKRSGLCPHCGQAPPAEGRKVCQSCAKQESEYHARRYRELKAKGLCRCKQPLAPGRSTCEDCWRRQKDADRRREERRRLAGLCVKCETPPAEGFVLCRKHLDLQAKRSVVKRAAAVASGVCRSCGVPWSGAQIDCDECRRGFAERRVELESKGLCRDCGERPAAPGIKVCQHCSGLAKARYDERKAAGLCVNCEAPVEKVGDATCRECRRASADRRARRRSEGA